jgi:TPR repeat protein
MLSIYLQNGFGTDKDLDASTMWLFKAANQHHPVAALEAGYWCRAQSKLVPAGSDGANKFINEMFNWYRVAGKNGLPMAEISMAYSYEEGLAVDQNKAIAYSMYHALALRDGRTFPTRHLNKQEMDHIRRRMALLKQECTSVEREGTQLRMVWGEDEIIITEKPEPARRNGTT